jgi:putative transcriptional regulator
VAGDRADLAGEEMEKKSCLLDIMFVIHYNMDAKRYKGNQMHLRNHVKQHRARLDLTQQELGEMVGVRRQTILALEKGHYVPSALLAFRLAAALGMQVDDLFELQEEGGEP